MTKKVVRLARLEGGVVVSVDDLLEFLGDMMGIFAKEDDALDEKLRNWHWNEAPKQLGMSMFAGQLTVLSALSKMLIEWKESEVKTGDADEAGKVLHVPERHIV